MVFNPSFLEGSTTIFKYMKKFFFSFLALLIFSFGNAQTAMNFNCNDCSGSNHELFSELDAGKVVVLCWVMPCVSCIGPASTAATTVSSLANPNVVFYLCDDFANTTCNTLVSWANTNSISADAIFSNSVVSMAPYGTPGMPKTVVLGGGNCRTVFLNENDALNTGALSTAIGNALLPCTRRVENSPADFAVTVFPDPVVDFARVKFSVPSSAETNLDVFNMSGGRVISISAGILNAGTHELSVSLESLNNGLYFLRMNSGSQTHSSRILVSR